MCLSSDPAKMLWQRWDSNPRLERLVPKTSALDRSATLPMSFPAQWAITWSGMQPEGEVGGASTRLVFDLIVFPQTSLFQRSLLSEKCEFYH